MAGLLSLIHRIHTAIRAYFVKRYRTRIIVEQFRIAHAQEIAEAPPQNWPMIQVRQRQEIDQIRAGNLQIVDRKSWAFPFLPSSVRRLAQPLMKQTPYNIRRLSRTPVARRAINLIKNSIITQIWDVRALEDVEEIDSPEERDERIKIAKKIFRHPNNEDSFQQFIEMGIEDVCCFGSFVAEMRFTLDTDRPLKLWAVNTESIRVFPAWSESTPEMPRYTQMTGLKGERGAILFYNDELLNVKDNPSTDGPFGMGRMEVAFEQLSALIGVQRMAGMAGADQIHKTWLWWEQPQADSAYQIVRRHIQNDLEGQARVSIIGGMKKPDVLEITPVTEADLLLNWQEMLIRMVANAFDLSAMALGIEHDVNRSTGQVLADKDFRSAVVPMAMRLQEAFTRKVLHEKLGWYDLEFVFLNLDDPDKQAMSEMLSRMFSANALTANQYRSKMGFEPLESPFADLTQFEMMMINAEAVQNLADRNAERMMKRQQDAQQQMMPAFGPPPPAPMEEGVPDVEGDPQADPQAGPPAEGSGGTGGGKGKITAPESISLPKFPIAGSRFTASQIAQMPVNRLQDLIRSSQLPEPDSLLKQMKEQEPGILERMTEEVRQFFEDADARAKKNKKKPLGGKTLKQWEQDQVKRFKKQESVIDEMGEWIQKKGQSGKPGGAGSSPYSSRAGRPGNVNPRRT